MKICEIINEARLDELVGVKDRGLDDLRGAMKQHDSETLYASKRITEIKRFVQMLQGEGWQHLGTASHGSVFTHPKLNYCIKLFSKDPMYLQYVKFCQENNEPCLPKFRGKLMKVDENTFAVRMETLTPISGKFYKELTMALCEFTSDYDWTVEGYKSEYDYNSAIGIYFKKNPDLLRTLKKLMPMVRPEDWDLGVDNVMLRGDTLVVTDPWAE